VEVGETLGQIAREYGTDVTTLLALNNLPNANFIYVGQQLAVPDGESYSRDSYRDNSYPDSNYGGNNGWQQPSWSGSQPQRDASSDPRQGGWGSQPGQPYTHAGLAWEPQGDAQNSNDGRSTSWGSGPSQQDSDQPGRSWEPQSPQGRPDRDSSGENYNGNYHESRSAGSNDDWGWVNSDQSSNRPGNSWEPQPQAGYGRESELTGEKWIDIDISDQRLTAYQGDTAVRYFTISSGSSRYPTVTGTFHTYARYELQDMSGGSEAAGDYYFQPDVPWIQYFFEGYAIHGAYWHNSFGRPIGHGCINMRVDDSRWLYDWAEVTGIRVEVHQ
jgi:LysM repeat protein